MRFLALLTVVIAACLANAQKFDVDRTNALTWRCIGPFRGGRTVGIDCVVSQPNIWYIGVNNGGVWKSTDYGHTWNSAFDDQPTGSVGCLAIAQSRPETVYVGSGEGLHRPDLSVGDGIYKTTDGGKTWRNVLKTDENTGANDLVVATTDPNVMYASTYQRQIGRAHV